MPTTTTVDTSPQRLRHGVASLTTTPTARSALGAVASGEKARSARLDVLLKTTMVYSLLADEPDHRPRSPTDQHCSERQHRRSTHSEPGDIVVDPLGFPFVPLSQRKYDFFINHAQATGADQCGKLALLLKMRGATVWYDMHANDLTKQGMEEGMSQSKNILIFLSKGVMGRPYCQAEQRWAKAYGCNFVGVKEVDESHCPADFAEEKETAPADLTHILDMVEFIPFRRRDYEEEAMIDQLLKCGGVLQ
eukprot:COSAG02_NODE_261_length_26663_cov_210.330899_13_plen_249_part_00